MADITKLRTAVIEKQEIILNRLTKLSYEEVIQMMASLSSLITNLDKIQAEEEVQCNRIMVREMEKDVRTNFSKAEAILKSTETYLSYKNIMSLKQCASRALSLSRLHIQHLLESRVSGDHEIDDNGH